MNKILVVLIFIAWVNCFYTQVDHNPLCLDFYSNTKQQKIAYDVVGSNPENMNITVYDSSNRIVKQFKTARDVATIKLSNRFKVCFSTIDNT